MTQVEDTTHRPQAPAASAWAESAMPAPALPQLHQDVSVEVAVIGAGFAGMNAAWELARRGVDCLVLDANDAGWGASGRNGGMAVLRYKKFWSALAAEFGNEATVSMHRWIQEGLDTLEENVQELGIECSFRRSGHITASHGTRRLGALEADCRWLATCAHDTTPRMLNASQAAELMGTTAYSGAYLDPRAASIHPLNYSRGFAAALQRRGVHIFRASPVTGITEAPDHLLLRTPGGNVRARRVIACTNAYSDLFDMGNDLGMRMLSISGAVVATEPLSSAIAGSILPGGQVDTDTRQLVN
jgi:glycine/D-amino acid oxidase-like deaminating enzyme